MRGGTAMSAEDVTPVDEEQELVDEVFWEKDPFRLAIRGVVLIEEVLEEAIDEAFRDGLPAELARLGRPSRVALAVALELITPDLGRAIVALGKIRNDFAHTMADEITEEHIQRLAPHARQFVPDHYDWERDSLFDLFQASMVLVYSVTLEMTEHATEQRAKAASELEEFRAGAGPFVIYHNGVQVIPPPVDPTEN